MRIDSAATGTKRAERKGNPPGAAPLMTDAQILEARALSQFAGWTSEALRARYGIDRKMMGRVLGGVTRARLVATTANLPEGVKPL